MAIIKLNYLSKALLRTVDVTVVLPTDTLDMVSLVIKMIGFMVPVFKDLRVKEDYVS